MFDTVVDVLGRLTSGEAYSRLALITELLLIGLAINWCVGKLQGARGTRPLKGLLVVLLVVTLVVRLFAARLEWTRLAVLYQYFVIGLAFIALVAFQPELRRAFLRAGELRWLRRKAAPARVIAALRQSAGFLSRNRYGAVIAIERGVDLRAWAGTGTVIDGEVTANLLNSIFFPNSPLHDLGVLLRGNRVLAANCQFPSAESAEVDVNLGSRHLAAVGMSYESDALVLVVSEETGAISLADNGQLTRFLSLDDLEEELNTRLSGHLVSGRGRSHWKRSMWRMVRRLLVVLPLTVMIWYLAEQATLTEAAGIRVELNITHDPRLQVDPVDPRPPVFSVDFRGTTRAIARVRADATLGALRVDWPLQVDHDEPGSYPFDAQSIIANAPSIRARGVSVVKAVPQQLQLEVDRREAVMMPVQPDAGAHRVSEVRFDPPEVLVTLRAADLAAIPEPQRVIMAPLDTQLADAPTERTLPLKDVALARTVAGREVVAVEPDVVDVTLRIVGVRVPRRLANVRVRLAAAPQYWQLYDVVLRDPNEWLIEVNVEGEKSVVESLRPRDVDAYVSLEPDLIQTTPEIRAWEVDVRLPAGVTLVGPKPLVHFRLIERAAPVP